MNLYRSKDKVVTWDCLLLGLGIMQQL